MSQRESLFLTQDTNPKKSNTLAKYLTIAMFVGAASYTVYNQQSDQIMTALEPEFAGSIDNIVENATEMVELDIFDDDLIEDASLKVGCAVNIERLMDQKTASAQWNANINSRSKFEDATFPARKDYALYWPDFLDGNAAQTVNQNKGYKDLTVWERPDEYETQHYKKRTPSLWGDDGIQPHGIKQGALGNCWFLSAAAALAETPKRIEKIFENKSYSPSGIFMVNMYVKGEPVRVVVDDRLPLYPNPTGRYIDQLFNAKVSPSNAWWGPILEKAYCKMNIACTYLNSGNAMQSFRDLTGMPVEQFRVRQQTNKEFFEVVKEAVNDNWMIVAGTAVAQNGLQSGHAYSIQDTYTHNGEDLVQLRNPWGSAKYNGKYSITDTRSWTSSLKKKLNWTGKNDGLFWMPVDLFRASFDEYIVCLYQDWKTDSFKVKKQTQSVKFNIKSPINQNAILVFDWQNERQVPPGECRSIRPNVNPNVFIRIGRQQVAQKASFRDLGLMYYRFPQGMKANTDYTIEYYDFNGSMQQDFTATLYTETQVVEMKQ